MSEPLEEITIEDQMFFSTNESIRGLAGKRFTDVGAKAYTKAARYEFQKHAAIKGLDLQHALEQLPEIAIKYQGNPDLIVQILIGRHDCPYQN